MCEPAWGCASRPGGAAGGLSPETASPPRDGRGLSPSTRAGRLSDPSVLLPHTWQSQGSEVSLTQPHQLKLGCWGAGRGAGRGGFGSFGKNRAAGSTGLGVLDLPRAREPVWGPHRPTCGGRIPCLLERGQGGERPAWPGAARSPARLGSQTSSRGEAKASALLSSRDAGLLEPPERPQWSPAYSSVWTVNLKITLL